MSPTEKGQHMQTNQTTQSKARKKPILIKKPSKNKEEKKKIIVPQVLAK